MGLMDFLKKKSDTGFDAGGMNFDNNFSADSSMGMNSMSQTPQSSFGTEFQPEHSMSNLSPSMNLSTMNNNAFGQPPTSMMPQSQGPDISKDLQMISLKLDSIKSELDAMNQRLKSLESIAEREQQKTTSNKKWY
jgi:hypothetical protein